MNRPVSLLLVLSALLPHGARAAESVPLKAFAAPPAVTDVRLP